jgi:site-specific DNA recombinase
MRAALYIRESTERQAEGYSPDMQEKALRRYAQEKGMEVVAVYTDYESGTTDQRPQFQALVEAAERHEFDALLVYHTSRFARDVELARRYKRRLREGLGIKVVFVSQALSDPDTPEGFLTEGITEVVDAHYSRLLGFWISRGYREKYEQGGLLGPLPLGYTVRRDDKGQPIEIVEDPATGPTIRCAFELYATGQYSLRELARWGAAEGLRSRKGNVIDRVGWQKTLTNPTYAGYVSYKRRQKNTELVRGTFEPLVPLAVYRSVQETLRERMRGPVYRPKYRVYVLSGVAVCDRCGGPLRGTTTNGRRYMQDYQANKLERTCLQRMVRADTLEEQVAAYLDRFRIPEDYPPKVLALLRARQTGDADMKRATLEKAQARLKDLYVWGHLSEDDYKAQERAIRLELARLRPPAEWLDMERAVYYLGHIDELYAKASPRLRQRFLTEVLEQVRVRDREVVAFAPKLAYLPFFALDRLEREKDHSDVKVDIGSPGRIRTYNLAVNSRPLYR